ncbi:hypothetical protein C8R44DRAFT_737540 [Mycena epipterygia]|nr:hypothetical protein C8R44DRAFT_737540 [Mycena epipterygia]
MFELYAGLPDFLPTSFVPYAWLDSSTARGQIKEIISGYAHKLSSASDSPPILARLEAILQGLHSLHAISNGNVKGPLKYYAWAQNLSTGGRHGHLLPAAVQWSSPNNSTAIAQPGLSCCVRFFDETFIIHIHAHFGELDPTKYACSATPTLAALY